MKMSNPYSFLQEVQAFADKRAKELGLGVQTSIKAESPYSQSFVLSLTAAPEGERKKLFTDNAARYGYEPTWLDRWFVQGRHRYQITGVNPGAQKSCIKMVRDDGKQFKCAPGFVRLHLPRVA